MDEEQPLVGQLSDIGLLFGIARARKEQRAPRTNSGGTRFSDASSGAQQNCLNCTTDNAASTTHLERSRVSIENGDGN